MATSTIAKTTTAGVGSPYQLNIDQTLKASKSLLHHVQAEAKRLREASSKKNLLDTADSASDSDGEGFSGHDTPIWLNLTCKQHIVDKNRLRPNKIPVPHSLNTSANSSICLISADPQRALKDLVADPTFPKALSSRISKIIGFTKLKARYHTFESRRQLLNEYDIFLADDRIITRLPETLGKVFYKGTAKRPIPIRIGLQVRDKGKQEGSDLPKKAAKEQRHSEFASPTIVAKEIETTLNTVPMSLKPGTSVAVRVALASFSPTQLAENVSAVALGVIEKHVVKGWRNVKSIHIKSPNSTAIPIWLANDMWTSDGDVVEDGAQDQTPAEENDVDGMKKRKRNPTSKSGPQAGPRKKAKDVKVDLVSEEQVSTISRKAKLAEQKRRAYKDSSGAAVAASV